LKPQRPTTQFYANVPKEPAANIEFRRRCLDIAWNDKHARQQFWIMCSRDLLFYINVFGWILEPRDHAAWQQHPAYGDAREIPFITRPYQDEILLEMQELLGKRDMLCKKSREMGLSWMALYLFDWSWRFEPQVHYGLVSKDEDTMDKPGDQGSLMVKLDFIDEHLPTFLQPKERKRLYKDHVIHNRDNGSTITGCACTGDMFSGNRKRAIWCDELHKWPAGDDAAALASTQYVTNCRIFCSTFNGQRGQSGAFFDLCENKDADMARIETHWSRDPDKAAGLYRYDAERDQIILLDKTYSFPPSYQFIKDDKTRSPYYDYECRRPGASARNVAAELDMDAGGATNRLFDAATIANARKQTRKEDFRCRLGQVRGLWQPQLLEAEEGPIQFWLPAKFEYSVDRETGQVYIPPDRTFVIGQDISQGLGGAFGSYSAAVVLDRVTGEQVAEFRHHKMKPEAFAEFCFALGMAFNEALMCPEFTGPGNNFTTKLVELHYPRLWCRPKQKVALDNEDSDRPGYDNRDGGRAALGELEMAMIRGKVLVRSERIVIECERYFENEHGDLKHPLVGKGRIDAPEKSHGDSAIACAMAWWAVHTDLEIAAQQQPEPEMEAHTLAWRRQHHNERYAAEARRSFWDPLESRSRGETLYAGEL